jgi:hypothetical protein
MGPLKAVFQWVMRTMMKDQTGVMRTLPRKDLVDFNVAMTAERLMRNGIDPRSLKNANQVENAIKSIESAEKANLAENIRGGVASTKTAKVFDMEGKEIPKGARIMGGKEVKETDAQIKARLDKDNKEGIARIRARQKMLDDAIDNVSPGLSGDRKVDAELVAEDLAERMGKVYDDLPTKERLKLYDEAYTGLSKKRAARREADADSQESSYDDGPADRDPDADNETFATGGIARLGLKEGSGMTRRTFLKLLGGMAAVPIVGKFFKLAKVGKTITKVPMIKTDNVPGKPEWFDQLVNKVIIEGDDVTKRFATGERQSIHQKTLDDGSVVRVTEDIDDGAVRVEYESKTNPYEETTQLEYKKPKPDESDPRPTAEFSAAETGPVARSDSPRLDYEKDIEEFATGNVDELVTDFSKLKEYATGKKPTMSEIVEAKKKKDQAKKLTEGDFDAEFELMEKRQGQPFYDPPLPDDFASGGIARMLGE